MPIRKFSNSIKKFSYKILNIKIAFNMSSSLADSETPGFSYLKLFKIEFQTEIASLVGQSPTVLEVVSLVLQNTNWNYLNEKKIKPTRFDETQSFIIEIEEIPEKPIRYLPNWDGDIEETVENFQERLRIYEIELKRWFTVRSFLYTVLHNYSYYRFQ